MNKSSSASSASACIFAIAFESTATRLAAFSATAINWYASASCTRFTSFAASFAFFFTACISVISAMLFVSLVFFDKATFFASSAAIAINFFASVACSPLFVIAALSAFNTFKIASKGTSLSMIACSFSASSSRFASASFVLSLINALALANPNNSSCSSLSSSPAAKFSASCNSFFASVCALLSLPNAASTASAISFFVLCAVSISVFVSKHHV